MKTHVSAKRECNILAYGIDRIGLAIPTDPIRARNYSITFEQYNSSTRFDAYNGVFVFQGTFESFQRKVGTMGSYLQHSGDPDELDKRKKETALLLDKGGFVCFLLIDSFIDSDEGRDFSRTDLAKFCLSFSKFHRRNYSERLSNVRATTDEFRPFLQRFGATSTHFLSFDKTISLLPIAKRQDDLVGFMVEPGIYAIPSLKPDDTPEVIIEYFRLLAEATTSHRGKLISETPPWLSAFQFAAEPHLLGERQALVQRQREIDAEIERHSRFKMALVHSSTKLVQDVCRIFETGFNIRIDATDEFREDVRFLDNSGEVVAVGEIKGTNRSVKREHINQTDSNRDRSGYDANFPALLIINTHIKSARSIAEKDQEIAAEQIRHAVKMNVLILRTLDLLELLRLVLDNRITTTETLSLLFGSAGWLRVSGDTPEIVTEPQVDSPSD